MCSSIQSAESGNEYRFLAYLNAALVRHKLKYFTQVKSSLLSIWNTDEQEDLSPGMEDVLVTEYPMMIGFQNELLSDALHQLTKKEKYVILSAGLGGRDHIQIAQDLNITLSAERMLFSRTRKKVRTYMEERENELRSTDVGSEDGE